MGGLSRPPSNSTYGEGLLPWSCINDEAAAARGRFFFVRPLSTCSEHLQLDVPAPCEALASGGLKRECQRGAGAARSPH